MRFEFFKSRDKEYKKVEAYAKRIELQYKTLIDDMKNMQLISQQKQDENILLMKRIEEVCCQLISLFDKRSLRDEHYFDNCSDIFSLIAMTVDAGKNYSVRTAEMLTKLTKKIEEKNRIIEGLSVQLSITQKQAQDTNTDEALDNKATSVPTVESGQQEVSRCFEVKEKSDVQSSQSSENENSDKKQNVRIVMNDNQEVIEVDSEEVEEVTCTSVPLKIQDYRSKNMNTSKKPGTVGPNNRNSSRQSDNRTERHSEESKYMERKIASKVVPKKQEPVYHVVDIVTIKEKIDQVKKTALLAVGKEGMSQTSDIKQYMVQNGMKEGTSLQALNELTQMGVLTKEKIEAGIKWFNIYVLSNPLGERLYKELFKKKPVLSEAARLKNENASLIHGYCIKTVADILKQSLRYSTVSMDRAINTIELGDGRKYIPDVIAIKNENREKEYYEVERGTHTQEDFNSKLDKAMLVTNEINIITPQAKSMDIIERKVGAWMIKKGNADLKGKTIRITTTKKLDMGQWDKEYCY